jgi:hypothetical protein
MKFFKNLLKGIGLNLVICLFVMMLLPAFLITDHVEAFDKVVSCIIEK